MLDAGTKEELAYLDVGDHPQRVRLGVVPESLLDEAGRPIGRTSTTE